MDGLETLVGELEEEAGHADSGVADYYILEQISVTHAGKGQWRLGSIWKLGRVAGTTVGRRQQ
mgnify:CR=1 FL=1